jgi:hypothetical protein
MTRQETLSQAETTVDGLAAYEEIYKQFWGEPLWQRRDVWLEKGGRLYTIACESFPNGFDTAQAGFDVIVSSFHVK